MASGLPAEEWSRLAVPAHRTTSVRRLHGHGCCQRDPRGEHDPRSGNSRAGLPTTRRLSKPDAGWHITKGFDPKNPYEGPAPAISSRLIIPGLAASHDVFHWIVQSFVVVLPEIQQVFLLSGVGVGGILAARELATGLAKLPGGVAVDILGKY